MGVPSTLGPLVVERNGMIATFLELEVKERSVGVQAAQSENVILDVIND